MRDQAIVAHFDARAQRYDGRIKHFIGEHELRAMRSVVSEGSSVLDYGCGTGRTALDLLRRGCRVTAYDPSSAMLGIAAERARRSGHDAEFVSDPAVLTSRTWPVVTCIGVLDYYPDPTRSCVACCGFSRPADGSSSRCRVAGVPSAGFMRCAASLMRSR